MAHWHVPHSPLEKCVRAEGRCPKIQRRATVRLQIAGQRTIFRNSKLRKAVRAICLVLILI